MSFNKGNSEMITTTVPLYFDDFVVNGYKIMMFYREYYIILN